MRFVECTPEERQVIAAAASQVRAVASAGPEPVAGDGRVLVSQNDMEVFDRFALGLAALKSTGRVVSVPALVSVMLGLGRALRECPVSPWLRELLDEG